MRGKAALLIGAGIGYVLGTRDGRERYEQIKSQANRLRNDPRVQEKAAQAQDLAKEKGPVAQQKVTEAAQSVAQKASDTVKSSDSTSTPGSTAPTNANPYPGTGDV